MLNQLEVRTAAGDLLTFVFDDVTDGYALEEIRGLDPVKATIVSSSWAGKDGKQYQSSRREERNIVISLGLEPDFVTTTVRTLRNALYKWFMTKSLVNLKFFDTEGPEVTIQGRVESCESPPFSKQPQMDISILCMDPDFLDIDDVSIDGDTVSDTTETLVTYDGTVDTGLVFVLNVDRTLSDFVFYHRAPDNTVKALEFTASLLADDIVTINTNFGSKSITLNRGGIVTSLLYAMSAQSDWISLQNGDNYIRVYATGAAIPYNITYTPRYGDL